LALEIAAWRLPERDLAFQVGERVFPDCNLFLDIADLPLPDGSSVGRDIAIVASLKSDHARKSRTQSRQQTSVKKLGVPRQISSRDALLFAISNTDSWRRQPEFD